MFLGCGMYTFQSAGLRDLLALNHLEKVCFVEDRWPVWDLFFVLTTPDVIRLKAVDEFGKLIGFIAGDLRESKRYGWIVTLGVLPEYQRQNIASVLLEMCEKQLRRDCIRLCVRRSNAAAVDLYIKQGYHQFDVWVNYYNGDEDALVLEKTLP